MCNKPWPSENKDWQKRRLLYRFIVRIFIKNVNVSYFFIFATMFSMFNGEKLTRAKNCRSTLKNPLPLIEMFKLLICANSSRLSKCNFWLSPDQNDNFSIFLINSYFWLTKYWILHYADKYYFQFKSICTYLNIAKMACVY